MPTATDDTGNTTDPSVSYARGGLPGVFADDPCCIPVSQAGGDVVEDLTESGCG